MRSGETHEYRAKAIVNSSDPWVSDMIARVAGSNLSRIVRLVKDNHFIIAKFRNGPQAYLVHNDDRRVIFINRYEGGKALIGTTDFPFDGCAEDVAADEDEIVYLLAAVN